MPVSMRLTITCKKCKGAGVVQLPEELERTLQDVILSGPDGATTEEIFKRDPHKKSMTRPAINARLDDLMREGLVTRQRSRGKFFIYTATAKGRRLTPTKKKRKPASGSAKTRTS